MNSDAEKLVLPEGRPRVAILGSRESRHVANRAAQLKEMLAANVEIVYSDFDASRQAPLATSDVDFAMTLGGDGTILRAASRLADTGIPVLGVNLGRLGFLAGIPVDQLPQALAAVLAGDCRVIDHLMFQCHVTRDGVELARCLGLNETAVLGGPPFRMMDVDLYIDGELVTTYSCDGLIISTPVGSTAHSLSAGGPILRKDLKAFVVQPISPHTLTVRPVVDTADRVFEVIVRNPNESASVVVDGIAIQALQLEDRVAVQRARQSFRMIEVEGHGYYRTLREKLGWGGRILRH